jgi:predicted amidohydrolase
MHDSAQYKLLEERLRRDDWSFRIALCPLGGEFHPYFELTPAPERFHIKRNDPMKNPHLLTSHISSLIEEAGQREVHLLVFPELTVCRPAREHIGRLLKATVSKYPYGVLAGSFHVWKEEGTQQGSDSLVAPFNEAALLERSHPLLTHHKRGRFALPAKAVTGEFFPDGVPATHESRVAEHIQRGFQLEFLETTFGTIAILICADLIDQQVNGYLSVVQTLRPDLLLVVAMSDETQMFQEKAQEMSEFGVGTLMVNASCVCQGARKGGLASCLAIAHLGLYQHPGAPPVFIRWRGNDAGVERWTYGQASKTWAEIDARSDNGVSWLEVEGQRGGLILDFGAHQRWLKALQ